MNVRRFSRSAIFFILIFFPILAHALPGDLDNSGRIDGYDLVLFAHANGSSSLDANWLASADLNGDGTIDAADLAVFSAHFGRTGNPFSVWALFTSNGYNRIGRYDQSGNQLSLVDAYNYIDSISGSLYNADLWVGYTGGSVLYRLDAKGATTRSTTSNITANAVAIDPSDGSAWIADSVNHRVIRLSPGIPPAYDISTDSGYHSIITGFTTPVAIDVDPISGAVWVLDQNNTLVRLTTSVPDGYDIGSDTGFHKSLAGFNYPRDISVNTTDGTVWVADFYHKQAIKVDPTCSTRLLTIGGFTSPVAVSVNPMDGSVWVADQSKNNVVHLGADGSRLSVSTGFSRPEDVVVNMMDGTCWVADYYNSQLVKLAPDGTELLRKDGFPSIAALTLIPSGPDSRGPEAVAAADATSVDTGQAVNFTGTGTDGDGSIINYTWDFDADGTVDYTSASTGATSHTYDTAGIYTPIFTVMDNDRLTASDQHLIIRVGNLSASASADVTSGVAPLAVNFSGTFVDPVDGTVSSFQWDFDGNGVFDWFSDSTPDIKHTYDRAGTYAAVFKVVDGPNSVTDTILITVSQAGPALSNVSATPSTVVIGSPVTFSAEADDPDGRVVLYNWDFDGDGTDDWSSIDTASASHAYASSGTYSARFTAIDNDGNSSSTTVDVTASWIMPTAKANADATRGHIPLSVNFTADGSTAPGGAITSYEWDFGECSDSIIFTDDFESGPGAWTADTPWAIEGTDVHGGTAAFTDSPDGNYSNNADTSITSTPIDVSSISSGTLSFWHHYNVENNYDYCRVEISTDNGTTWQELEKYTGNLSAWTEADLDFSTYLPASSLIIRFRLTADGSQTSDGWNIDDISITGCVVNWTASPDGTATHTYTQPADWSAVLRVTDSNGNTDTDSITVNAMANDKPLATASADPASGAAPLTVSFTGTGTEPNGNIASYEWNFGEEYVWFVSEGDDFAGKLAGAGDSLLARAEGFNNPAAVAVDSTGTAWVTDTNNSQVVHLSADGAELARISGFYYPRAITIDNTTGKIWVSDTSNNQVVRLSSDGTEEARVSGFSYPQGIAADGGAGVIWITDYYNSRVIRLDSDTPNGYNIASSTGKHMEITGFYYPIGIAVNTSDSSVWVADTYNSQVVRLSSDGTEEARISGLSSPQSIVVVSGSSYAWVADIGNNLVVRLDISTPDGYNIASDTGHHLALTGFSSPNSMAVNPHDGSIFVADYYNDRIARLSEDGSLISTTPVSRPLFVSAAGFSASNYSQSATTSNASHTYDNPGIYQASLKVTDDAGNSDTATLTINISGAPQANLSADTTAGTAPLEVFFNAWATDTYRPVTDWEWDFEGDGTFEPGEASASHVFNLAGDYDAAVRVTDSAGKTDTAIVTINVSQASPIVTLAAGPGSGNTPLSVTFTASASDPDGTITGYEWDFDGDGVYDTSGPDSSIIHIYNATGDYDAKVRVTDNDGNTSGADVSVQVSTAGTPAPVLTVTRVSGTVAPVFIFRPGADDVDANITSYSIDFDGDGTPDLTQATPFTAFFDSAERGALQWTATGSWGVETNEAHSGDYCFTESPDGNYADSEDSSLTSVTIDLSSSSDPWLIFYHKYSLKSYDYAYVDISANDGANWTNLEYFSNATQSAWTRKEYSLVRYAGNSTVKIRFHFTSNSTDTADGWRIDDISVGDSLTHEYASAGSYSPVLTVVDADGNTASATGNVFVPAVDDESRIWVADYSNNRVVKMAPDGTVLASFPGFRNPRDVSVDHATGDAWVADTSNNQVVLLDASAQNGYDISRENTADNSDTGTNGVLMGDATMGTGKFGNGIVLDGSGDYVQIPDSPVFHSPSWTMEAWIKPAATTNGANTIFGKISSGKDFGIMLYYGKPTLLIYESARRYLSAVDAVVIGQWYHIAATFDAATHLSTLYVNGAQAAQWDTYRPDMSNPDPICIGRSYCCSEYFNGTIDEVRFWNYARSAAEITAAMNGEIAGTNSALYGYWQLNGTVVSHQASAGFSSPFWVSVASDSTAWVADYYNNQVVHLAADGTELSRLDGFSRPRNIAIDPTDGSIWVTDESNGQVVHMDASGTELSRTDGFSTPVGVVVNKVDSSVWVTDFYHNQVVHIKADGTELLRISGFYNPVGIDMNQADGNIWVADFSNDQVVKLSPAGAEILRLTGFDNPHSLKVDQKDGSVWVSDHYHNQEVHLSPDGTEIGRFSGFNRPINLSIDHPVTRASGVQVPVVSASVDPASGSVPLDVTFSATATDDGSIASYLWDFDGDGAFDYSSTSTASTTHSYLSPGIYFPTLKVIDNDNFSAVDTSLAIHAGGFVISASATPDSATAPVDIALNGAVTVMPPERRVVSYQWDFDGDGVFDYTNAVSPKTSHRFQTAGDYNAVLEMTDDTGDTAYASVNIPIATSPPNVTNYASPTSGTAPLTVTLDASASDTDGSIVLYQWDYDGDGIYDWYSAATGNTYFTYTAPGTYEAVIKVTDNDGLSTTGSKTITVASSQKPPTLVLTADTVEGHMPLTVTFIATATDPDGNITNYEWDFDGDGTADEQGAALSQETHVYDTSDTYIASVIVTDNDGLSTTKNILVTVKPAGAPTAVAQASPDHGQTPLDVSFDGSSSTDSDGSITAYKWYFGDSRLWVGDSGHNSVNTYSGMIRENTSPGFSGPTMLAIDSANGTAWVSDFYHNQVVKINADNSSELLRINGFYYPYGLDVVNSDHSVWVADYNHHQVVHLNADGTELSRISGFYNPRSVAVDQADDSVWVADYNNHQVVHLNSAGEQTARVDGFYNPYWVAVDQTTRNVWVADYNNNRVVRLAHDTPDGFHYSNVSLKDLDAVASMPGLLFDNAMAGAGDINGGLALDGNGDYVLIPAYSSMDVSSFTIEAWIKPTVASGRAIFMRGDSGGGNEIYFGMSGTTGVDTVVDGKSVTFNGSVSFEDGAWHHVALVFDHDAGQLSCYVDGTAYGATPTALSADLDFGNSRALIGADFDSFNAGLGNWFSGGLDEVRLWNTARTQPEIAGAMNSEAIGTEEGLVFCYHFNSISDAGYALAVDGFNRPTHVSVDPNDSSVWVCNPGNDEVVKLSGDYGRRLITLSGLPNPYGTVVDPGSSSMWVAEYDQSQTIRYSAEGVELTRISEAYHPVSVAVYSGANSSSNQAVAAHTFPVMGNYPATLTVTDDSGLSDTDQIIIHAGTFPVARPGAYPTTGKAPLEVVFTAAGDSPTGTLEYYYWDYGDGINNNSNPLRISGRTTHTYGAAGTYTAILRVVDNKGNEDSTSVTITVIAQGTPDASATAVPNRGNPPLAVSFTGFGTDKDGTITSFDWDFEGDGTWDVTGAADGAATHTYNSTGNYNAVLRVTDNDGNTATDTATVQVVDPGTPIATAAADPSSGPVSLDVNFTGSATDNGSITQYAWDFDGDGNFDFTSQATGNITHTYTLPGTYNAVFSATDNSGLTDTVTVPVTATLGLTASLEKDLFDPSSGQTLSINSALTGSATVTVRIMNSVGASIRTLVSDEARTAGYYSDPWDGKDDSGVVMESGVYYFIIIYTTGGQTYVYDLTNTAYENYRTPGVVYPASFDPFSAETNFFRYSLDYKSEVTIYISTFSSGAGDRVKTLQLRTPQKAGNYVQVWDGSNDSGDLVDPGNYVIAVFSWDLPGNAMIIENRPVIGDIHVSPAYFNPAGLPYDPTANVTLTYSLTKTADVTADILDEDNFKVRVLTAQNAPAGTSNTLLWDGTNTAGEKVAPGAYRVRMKATDLQGHVSVEANTVMVIFY